jgi:hypothetical protein
LRRHVPGALGAPGPPLDATGSVVHGRTLELNPVTSSPVLVSQTSIDFIS